MNLMLKIKLKNNTSTWYRTLTVRLNTCRYIDPEYFYKCEINNKIKIQTTTFAFGTNGINGGRHITPKIDTFPLMACLTRFRSIERILLVTNLFF